VSKKPRTNPRKAPQQERSREMVEAIVEATARVLVRDGYEGTNTNRIAEVAGISVGSLYQYFPSKEALVAQLIERHTGAMWAVYQERAAKVFGASLEAATKELVRAMIEAHEIDPKLHRVLIEQVPRVGGLGKVNEVTERVTALVQSFLEERRAEILPRDPSIAAFVVVNTIEAIAHQAVVARTELLEEGNRLIDETISIVLRYLTGRDAAS
jgi:AcrR family transcriptional regulator